MKKYVLLLFFLIIGCGTLFGEKAEAVSKIDQTDLSITFLHSESLNPEAPIIKVPTLPVGTAQIKNTGKLPSTGDLITSLIWTLIGFSLMIVFIGVYSLKNIMLKLSWE